MFHPNYKLCDYYVINIGIRGQKGSRGEKGARGLPGTCSQQMVERTLQSGDTEERHRSRRSRDRSEGEEEREEEVKNMLTTLFGTCVNAVLADEDESSAFGNRSKLFND